MANPPERAPEHPPGEGLRFHYDAFLQVWRRLSFYERFERTVALMIAWLIAAIIVMALWELAKEVAALALADLLNPLDPRTFQRIFGQIMTVLIALEFKHSIIRVVAAGEGIIQVRTVLLIALLALARKVIVLDLNEYSSTTILALAALLLALGVTYWLVRYEDARQELP